MHPVADSWFRAVVPVLAYRYLRLLHLTMTREFQNREAFQRARHDAGGFIMAFWHSRFLMMPYAYPGGGRLMGLLSRHRDAQMLGGVLQRFDVEIAWGSSTAGGVTALRTVLRHIRAGFDVGLAPDGPRGPRRRVKPGIIAIARLSGLPIVPIAFSASRARRLRSWDRTLVPRLFARGLWAFGEPQAVPRDAGPEEQERYRMRLERELDRLTDETDRAAGLEPEEPRPPVDRAAEAG